MVEMSFFLAKVANVFDEAIDVKSFELMSADGAALPAFTPGAHVDVYLDNGLIRQYSLWNAPSEGIYRIAVKKEAVSRGGSEAMHSSIRIGQVLKVGLPRNNFMLEEGNGPVLLIAGGIGITPLLSMAHALLESGRSFAMHYFTRSVEHTAFHRKLSSLEFFGKVTFRHDNDPEKIKRYLSNLLRYRPLGAQLYFCGPRPFMDTIETIATECWPAEAIHREYFGAAPDAVSATGLAFTVRLARSGDEYLVAADKSIVQTLAAHGIEIPTSCEQGVCGTCLTAVLEGVPDHRDEYMTDAEKARGDKICLCVSRAKSAELVLDL
jgi:vanillate O-demethylase ferredoxin subunit